MVRHVQHLGGEDFFPGPKCRSLDSERDGEKNTQWIHVYHFRLSKTLQDIRNREAMMVFSRFFHLLLNFGLFFKRNHTSILRRFPSYNPRTRSVRYLLFRFAMEMTKLSPAWFLVSCSGTNSPPGNITGSFFQRWASGCWFWSASPTAIGGYEALVTMVT